MPTLRTRIACLALFAALTLATGACAQAQPAGSISYDHHCFTVNGQDVVMYSGSIHYFRVPRELWKDRLLKARAAGINTIATCVPWNYHEPVKGKMDLSELADYIDLCDEMGFYFTARIGPFICAEWDNGGFPDWLLTEGITVDDLRTNHNPYYVELVNEWYAAAAEVLRPRLVSRGGSVVAVQVENEYGARAPFKTDVIRKRYQMIRELDIDVPVVTCNTDCAWDNEDPVMADIVNGNNTTVVRWSNINVAERRTAEARRHETNAPTIVLENPGGQGMFSNVVDFREQLPLDAADYNVVNKTLWAEGASLANYYMFHGGTNLGYTGSRYQSTSYANRPPVQAFVDESGGLLDSYYTAKLIGQWLNSFGATLVRAVPVNDARIVDSNAEKSPRLVCRRNGQTTFFFLRDAQDRPQTLRLAWTDPGTNRELTIPSTGRISLLPRDMIILTANVPLGNGLLKYSTSEILGIGACRGQDVVVVYGPTGAQGQLALTLDEKPAVINAPAYDWNSADKTLTLDYLHTAEPRFLRAGPVAVVILDRDAAQTTWFAPVGDGQRTAVVSNSYLVADSRYDESLVLDVQTRPGDTRFSAFFPAAPAAVQVDGSPVQFRFDESTGRLDFACSTPAETFQEITFDRAPFRTEDLTAGQWQPIALSPSLDEQGILGKSYFRYSASFQPPTDADSMTLEFYEGSSTLSRHRCWLGDPICVFVNGQLVEQASGYFHPQTVTFSLADYLRDGENRVDVLLERMSRANGGGGGSKQGLLERKGLAKATIAGPGEQPWTKEITGWKYIPALQGQLLGYQLPEYDHSDWNTVVLGDWKSAAPELEGSIGVGWYRLEFDLDQPKNWSRPLQIMLELNSHALIYLNGRLVGRYHQLDWQREFYLPEPWLNHQGRNVIAIAVRNDPVDAGQPLPDQPGLIQAAVRSVEPAVVRNRTVNIAF